MVGSMYQVIENTFFSYFIYLLKIDNLDDERNWIHKYIEVNQTKRTLTFHSNEVCHLLS